MSCISAKIDVVNCSTNYEFIVSNIYLNTDILYKEKNLTVEIPNNIHIENKISNYNLNISTSYSNNLSLGISMICDINGGIPLYAEDGSLLTFEGYPIYVRKAKIKNYE